MLILARSPTFQVPGLAWESRRNAHTPRTKPLRASAPLAARAPVRWRPHRSLAAASSCSAIQAERGIRRPQTPAAPQARVRAWTPTPVASMSPTGSTPARRPERDRTCSPCRRPLRRGSASSTLGSPLVSRGQDPTLDTFSGVSRGQDPTLDTFSESDSGWFLRLKPDRCSDPHALPGFR
jgi:hypothetical protein